MRGPKLFRSSTLLPSAAARIHVHRIGIALVLVTQTEIQSESRSHAPVVLDEVVESVVFIVRPSTPKPWLKLPA
jgi:hypothetical protein